MLSRIGFELIRSPTVGSLEHGLNLAGHCRSGEGASASRLFQTVFCEVTGPGDCCVSTRHDSSTANRGPALPSHSPIRGERKQSRLRTALRKGYLFH